MFANINEFMYINKCIVSFFTPERRDAAAFVVSRRTAARNSDDVRIRLPRRRHKCGGRYGDALSCESGTFRDC